MKLRKFLPWLTLLLCIPGIVLRAKHFLTGFDIGTGLPVAGNGWMIACIVLFVAAFAAFVLLSGSLRQERDTSMETLLGTDSAAFRIAAVVTGLLMLIGAATYIYLTVTSTEIETVAWAKILELVYAALTAVAGVSVIGLARLQNGQEITAPRAAMTLASLLWSCVHLLVSYRLTCVDPKLPSFAFGLIADVLLVLAFYHLARLLYGKPRPDFLAPLCAITVLISVSDLGGYGAAWLMGMRALSWSAKQLVRGGLTAAACVLLVAELFLLARSRAKH